MYSDHRHDTKLKNMSNKSMPYCCRHHQERQQANMQNDTQNDKKVMSLSGSNSTQANQMLPTCNNRLYAITKHRKYVTPQASRVSAVSPIE